MKQTKEKISKCSKCGAEFKMPVNFMGRILCEDCDSFMNQEELRDEGFDEHLESWK
jgi:hypothetical protein